MRILSPAFKGYIRLRQSLIDNFMLSPFDTQTKVFNDLISSAQFTEFGRSHGFQHIDSLESFKSSVPIFDYNGMKPYIDRIMRGEQEVLWDSPINWFAKSSGTTGDRSKFIPVSKETLNDNHYKAGKDVLSLYIRQFPQSNLMNGKCLTIGGSHQINQLNTNSYYGDLSAVMLQNMSIVAQQFRAPELSVALMDEWEAKLEAIAQSVLHEDITFIAGVPTWTLLLIKRLFEITGKDNLKDIWPNLELYIHGGVNFLPYQKQFETLIRGDEMHYLETYNASEGFFAAQDDLNFDGMLLFLNHGILFEFMPMEEYGSENPRTLTLKQVELDKDYALVISTNSGLWRYLVGDTIRFVSLAPFRIKVSGRVRHFINAFGEEVIVSNSDEAIAKACEQTGAKVNDYTAAPVYMSQEGNGTHEWIIEFDQLTGSLEDFTQALDQALQKINSDYEAKRHKDMALRMPIVHRMPVGGFNRWLKQKGKLGGQNKVPRLSNNRQLLEEILTFMNSETLSQTKETLS